MTRRMMLWAFLALPLWGCVEERGGVVSRRDALRDELSPAGVERRKQGAQGIMAEWVAIARRSGFAPVESQDMAEAFDIALTGSDRFFADAALANSEAALAALAEAAKLHEGDGHLLLWQRATLLYALGRVGDAHSEAERSFAIRPTLSSSLFLLDGMGRTDPAGVNRLCVAARPHVEDLELFSLMTACFHESHALSLEAGLAWTSAEDRAWYVQKGRQLRKAELERMAREEARKEHRDEFQQQMALERSRLGIEVAALTTQQAQLEEQRRANDNYEAVHCRSTNVFLATTHLAPGMCN